MKMINLTFLGATPYGFTMNAVNRVKQSFIPFDTLRDNDNDDILNEDGDFIIVSGGEIDGCNPTYCLCYPCHHR